MIRRAEPQDAAALAALWNPWIVETAITFNSVPKTADDLRQMMADRDRAGHGIFVAETAAGLAGFAGYAQFRAGPGYATCMEHTIILQPALRGQGLGRALLTAVEDHARQAGAHQMIAGISGENPAACAFHAAMGYRQVARLAAAGFKFGRFIDLVLMQKFLT